MPSYCLVCKRSLVSLVAAILLGCLLTESPAATTVPAASDSLSLELDATNGTYRIFSQEPAWVFGGSLGVPLQKVATTRGHDHLGDFQQTAFAWTSGNLPMSGQIRLYNRPALALFSQTCGAASDLPPAPFPAFTQLPAGLHVFSYGHREFAPPEFNANEISTPCLLFDDQADAFIISPASHFMVASMLGDGQKTVASGFNPKLAHLPQGFTQQTLIALGQGINRTWESWGRALLAFEQANRPSYDADTVLKYLGYWTDNGAYYYYNYDLEKGYAGTLLSLADYYRQQRIPIRYLQLDSWWYSKTTTGADGAPGKEKKSDKLPAGEWNRYGGLLEYKAHHDLFPNGLAAFQQALKLPLITHNRWIDPASPYHEHYQISGIAAVDPRWWDSIAAYMKASGIVTYEQDWLDRIFTYSPAFTADPETGEAFLDNMARACREQDITVQYCMPYPCYFLQGSRYQNLTTIRTSGDRFTTNKWNSFLYTSRLASSLGIWPWADVYMSTETQNVLLSTLSAGPVGIGDALGAENKANLLRAVRGDGVIVKPDAPIVPLDRCYLADVKKLPAPLIASTGTDHGGIKTAYVFAFNRHKAPGGPAQFTPAELGLNHQVYVYDYFAGTGRTLDSSEVFSSPLGANASAFFVLAPVGQSGIAFLGDQDKFVGTGKQRIASLRDEAGRLTVAVLLAENEQSVTLHGYAAAAPKATVSSGLAEAVQYESATHHFAVTVKPSSTETLDRSAGDPVRRLTVVLETQPGVSAPGQPPTTK